MEELNQTLLKKRGFGYAIIAIFFVFVSLSTFIGVRYLYPIIVYNGRSSLYTLPAGITYLIPLIIFYLILVAMYTKTVHARHVFIKILGFTLIVCSIFNETAITFCITLLWNGQTHPGLINPVFPLDVILLNIAYFLGGITSLLFERIDRKYELGKGVSSIPLKTSRMVGFGFFLPFASYFLGEFIFCFIFLQERFLDPNWHYMIPHYLSFLLPTLYFGLYMVIRFLRDPIKKRKFAFGSLIFIYASSIGVFSWIYIGLALNPYLIAESLQWEYELALPLKFPAGILATTLICLIIAVTASIKLFTNKKSDENEQKQETIQ